MTFTIRYRLHGDGAVLAEQKVEGPAPYLPVPRKGDRIAFSGAYATFEIRSVLWDIYSDKTTVIVYCA